MTKTTRTHENGTRITTDELATLRLLMAEAQALQAKVATFRATAGDWRGRVQDAAEMIYSAAGSLSELDHAKTTLFAANEE